jgi:hypothetical protein
MHPTLARIAAFLGVKVIYNSEDRVVSESSLTPDLRSLIDAREAYEEELVVHQNNVYSYEGDPNSTYIINERTMMNNTAKFLANTNTQIRALLEDQNLTERETADPNEPVFDEIINHPNGTAVRKVRFQDGSGTDELYGTDDVLTHFFKIYPDGTREEI